MSARSSRSLTSSHARRASSESAPNLFTAALRRCRMGVWRQWTSEGGSAAAAVQRGSPVRQTVQCSPAKEQAGRQVRELQQSVAQTMPGGRGHGEREREREGTASLPDGKTAAARCWLLPAVHAKQGQAAIDDSSPRRADLKGLYRGAARAKASKQLQQQARAKASNSCRAVDRRSDRQTHGGGEAYPSIRCGPLRVRRRHRPGRRGAARRTAGGARGAPEGSRRRREGRSARRRGQRPARRRQWRLLMAWCLLRARATENGLGFGRAG